MMAPFDIDYTEGLKIGYKWFDAERKEPLFPFGFGLSYTTFSYSGLKAGIDSVTFTVRNTGKRAGAEIAGAPELLALKQQGREFVQIAPPAQPLVRG
jgi:hypothetical protein